MLTLMLFTVGRPGKTQTKIPVFLILYGQTLNNIVEVIKIINPMDFIRSGEVHFFMPLIRVICGQSRVPN
jgi:hypothetical protein